MDNEFVFRLSTQISTGSGLKMAFKDWLHRYADIDGRQLFVGTDSQQATGVTKFTTCVVSYEPGHGGCYAYVRYQTPRIRALPERLKTEAWRSIEVALLVLQELPHAPIVVHIDVNPDVKYKSGILAPGLVGMVTAQGLRAEIKPKAFSASHLADQLVKHR